MLSRASAARSAAAHSARLATSSARICEDQLKYDLLNITQPSTDKRVHTQRRLKMYKDTFQLVQRSHRSPIKADNLYVLLYSRYYTTRSMIQQTTGATGSLIESDEALKLKFKVLVNKEFVARREFETAYGVIVKSLKPDAVAALYTELTDRLCACSAHKTSASGAAMAPLTPEELEAFYLATIETDTYLTKKLQQDVDKLSAREDRVLDFLHRYRFVAGWVTAAGIAGISLLPVATSLIG